MSRAAKSTLVASIVASSFIVWGVHFMQNQERETMYKGVERDEARQAAKRAQRQADLIANQERQASYQAMQPTTKSGQSNNPQEHQQQSSRSIAAYAILEGAEDKASALKHKAEDLLQNVGGVGDDADRRYIAGRWGINGVQLGAIAATPLYALGAIRRGGFSIRRLASANWRYPVIGGVGGYASGYVYAQSLDPSSAASQSFTYRHDPVTIRRDDHYLIGGVVGGLLTPAIFLGRTGLINGLLGGAFGFGGLGGMAYDLSQRTSLTESNVERAAKNATEAAKAEGKAAFNQAEQKGDFLVAKARAKAENLRKKGEDAVGGK